MPKAVTSIRLLKQYLSWCVTRYIPRARQNSTTQANIEVVFADVADVIERRFESHIINVRPDHARYRSLTDTQLQIIRTLIRPGSAENPFPERLQLRNWLMIELLLETGIRRGVNLLGRGDGMHKCCGTCRSGITTNRYPRDISIGVSTDSTGACQMRGFLGARISILGTCHFRYALLQTPLSQLRPSRNDENQAKIRLTD